MPGLDKTYGIEIKIMSGPIAEYNTEKHFEQDLAVAPEVMAGEQIAAEGKDVSDEKTEKRDLQAAVPSGT